MSKFLVMINYHEYPSRTLSIRNGNCMNIAGSLGGLQLNSPSYIRFLDIYFSVLLSLSTHICGVRHFFYVNLFFQR